jgi:RNA polymerase sigma-70 factor, ECF subfamily
VRDVQVAPASAIAIGWTAARDLGITVPDRVSDDQAGQVEYERADEAALVRAFVAGHREAFDEIVVRHRRTVYQLCYRFACNHEDAADLAQDVFVRAFKGLARFKGEATLATWLHRVAVNVCLNRAATKRPAADPIEEAPPIESRTESPLQAVLRTERAAEVRRAIEKLPPKQRATLILRVYQELSHEEIARVLGGSVGAVKTSFFHALGNLRRLLKSR